jgi:hypothetical protein
MLNVELRDSVEEMHKLARIAATESNEMVSDWMQWFAFGTRRSGPFHSLVKLHCLAHSSFPRLPSQRARRRPISTIASQVGPAGIHIQVYIPLSSSMLSQILPNIIPQSSRRSKIRSKRSLRTSHRVLSISERHNGF